ncbi:MAG: Holliday junction resolvase RuvX [Ktedonobacterales bacterium]
MVIVALDVGSVRIGVAVCDELEQIATPHATIRRTSNAAARDAIARVVAETGAELLVIGLPVSYDGQLHEQARSVLAFGRKLQGRLSVPMVYADETLSSVRAEEALRAAGMRPERIRERIDAAAAALILRDYLDTRRVVNVEALLRPPLDAGTAAPLPSAGDIQERTGTEEEGMAEG